MTSNEPVEYNIKKDENKNNPVQENNQQISETNRVEIQENPDPKDINENNTKSFIDIIYNFFKTKKIIWIPIVFVLLTAIILAIVLPIALKNKKKGKTTQIEEEEEKIPINNIINLEEAKVIFSPSFKINTKVETLMQLSQKFLQNYETEIKGQKSKMSILNKAVYDIYTLNSTKSSKEDKYFYTNIYSTVIAVNSLCAKSSFDSAEVDCDLEQYLDLNQRENNNLRRNEEENEEELLESAIIPLCIVEHTDTNLIISLTCPKTLEENFKNDIIRAFQKIKPDTMKGYEFDKNYVDTFSEEKDDKIYTTSFDNVCQEPNIDPNKIIICNLTKNIVTDKEGNLISSKVTTSEKTTKDESDIFINNFLYEYENIPKEKSSNFNQEIFKSNLNTILPKINFLMEKEIYISNFTDFAIDIMTEDESYNKTNKTKLRSLSEQTITSKGVQEENIFNKSLFVDVSVFFNLKNDIGLDDGKNTKAISTQNINEENNTQLSYYQYTTNLNETLNKFIILSKSGNVLANKLYEELNEPLLKIGDIITKNIEKINNFLANKDLSEIFDSTSAINQLSSLNYEFVVETDNLYNSMNELSTNLLYTINTAKERLKKDVSDFLTESHNLMYTLFNKLTDVSNALSSDKSKLAEISSYYLNNTDEAYYDLILNASNILQNYYINESELITKEVNPMIEYFYGNITIFVAKYQNQLDEINDRLNEGDLTIVHSTNEDYQKVIKNIYNTKLKANEIIETVRNKFQESINLQSNGFFETNKEIEENNKTYNQICEQALSISYALDKNELIDKTFDTVWTSLRDKFIDNLKFMEDSTETKFPLQENVLSSFFDGTFDELKEFLKNEKTIILENINNENKKYLEKVNDELSSFKGENDKSLDQIISELLKLLTDIKIYNLNNTFNASLALTLKSITEIIENNKNKAYEYLNENQIASSYHITTGYINKYNDFYNSIQSIENFLNNNLKNNFVIKYKNVVNQIRAQLQSIKSNKILEKYYKQLPTAENHLNSIKDLFTIFERHFSDSNFNDVSLPTINKYIQITNDNIKEIKQKFQDIYNNIAKKGKNNILYDYDVERLVRRKYCCKRFLGFCVRHCYDDTYYYDGYNTQSTNNHLNLKEINFESYIKEFDEEYTQLYSQLSNNVLSYNSLLSSLDTIIESKKDEFLSSDINYLQNIPQKINTILEEKYGDILLESSYNYYKDKITNVLPIELNNIINKWSNNYDDIYEELNSNKNNFKSSLDEFLYLPSYSTSTYMQNNSYDYGEAVVEKLKNEFMYTNKYYYNLLISKMNQTYDYILNNLPNNEKPFDEILNLRKSQIKTIYQNIQEKIYNSKNAVLDSNKQKTLLQINDKNFFNINDVISNHIKNYETAMNAKMGSISSIIEEISNDCSEELMAAKFYLEKGFLTKKQLEIGRKKIMKYSKQLTKLANEQALQKASKHDLENFND